MFFNFHISFKYRKIPSRDIKEFLLNHVSHVKMATNGTPRRKIALITGITGQVKYTYMVFWRLIFLAKGVYFDIFEGRKDVVYFNYSVRLTVPVVLFSKRH